jgi:hypothetical protein
MTTIALDKAYASIATLTGMFNLPYGQKNVSTMKEVICITTDKASVESSKKLIKFLATIKADLPIEKGEINPINIEHNLSMINGNLTQINSFFQTIKDLFDGGSEINIDDPNMLSVLSNLEKAQSTMEYISDYLTLLLTVQKYKNEEVKEYNLDNLLQFLNAA